MVVLVYVCVIGLLIIIIVVRVDIRRLSVHEIVRARVDERASDEHRTKNALAGELPIDQRYTGH